MDVSRLRTLRELSLRKTMAAVAEALLLSPSAISQQLSQLEGEAGVQLIDRRGRGVTLTPAGERLAEHAERIMRVLEEAKTDMAELKRVVAGEIRVAAFPSIAGVLIPGTMRALQDTHPRLRVTFEELEPTDGLAALRAWQADVALVDDLTLSTTTLENSVDMIHLTDDLLYVLLPPTHPLADRDDVSVEMLREDRWAFDTASSAYAEMITRTCTTAGFEPIVNAKCNSFQVVVELVRVGCSISILPGYRIRGGHRGVRVLKVVPEIRRKIFAAVRRGERRNPAIAAFLGQIEGDARALGAGLDRP